MSKEYTTEELAEIFEVSTRSIQRYLKKISDTLSQSGKNRKIPFTAALEIAVQNNFELKDSVGGQVVVTETYTAEDYEKVEKMIQEYPTLLQTINDLKEELDFRQSLISDLQQKLDKSLLLLEQRNKLEALRIQQKNKDV